MASNILLEIIWTLTRTQRKHTQKRQDKSEQIIFGKHQSERTYLQMVIKLWEIKNEEVHIKEEVVKQQIKERQSYNQI